jgi:hypothetical protein
MATKRAAAKAEAAQMIDIAARLAPFFPSPVADAFTQNDSTADPNVAGSRLVTL